MRSFTLSALATLAFGIFCSAAPTPSGLPAVGIVARDAPVPNDTLQSALSDAASAIDPLVDQISKLHTVEATVQVVTPILNEAIEHLEDAVNRIQALVKIPVDDALRIADGALLDVADVADLVVSVIRGVLALLQGVLALVNSAVWGQVLPLVLQIVQLVGQLLAAVIELVASVLTGLVDDIVDRIEDLIPVILDLNAREILVILGVSV